MSKKIKLGLLFVLILATLAPISFFLITNQKLPMLKNIQFSPQEITDVLNNPYMGWVPPADGGPYQQPHTLVYAGITWAELEPVKGSFNWSGIEEKYRFNYWGSEGVKINLRFILDLPGKEGHKDIPGWLYDEMEGDGTWYDSDSGAGFSPSYNNPVLISNHSRMIKAAAERYGKDSRVAFIQLGSLGHWGEWHTCLCDPASGSFPLIPVSNQYASQYLNTFAGKIFSMRRPFQIAKDNNMGLFNDMFGSTPQTNSWIDWINNGYVDDYGQPHPAMPDFWEYAPSGGEFAYGNAQQYLQDDTIGETLRQANESHTSWLGPSCPANLPTGCSEQSNIDALHKTMGYRFVLQSASHANIIRAGSALTVEMKWINKGTSPFYFDWPMELSLSNRNGRIVAKTTTSEDIRTWLPGTRIVTQKLDVPSNLWPGTYTLCVAIVDPSTGKPGINFAITNRRTDGRYGLAKVTVYK